MKSETLLDPSVPQHFGKSSIKSIFVHEVNSVLSNVPIRDKGESGDGSISVITPSRISSQRMETHLVLYMAKMNLWSHLFLCPYKIVYNPRQYVGPECLPMVQLFSTKMSKVGNLQFIS